MADALLQELQARLSAHWQDKGKDAFLAGDSRESHDLCPSVPQRDAIADFHAGWDTAASNQFAIAPVQRVDAAQVAL